MSVISRSHFGVRELGKEFTDVLPKAGVRAYLYCLEARIGSLGWIDSQRVSIGSV